MPLFSIIVPTRDRHDLLAEALQSVSMQRCGDFECLVVNDAGKTPDLPADGRFRLIELALNVGCAEARNAGLRAAVGQYVVFLDDDDVFTPSRLSGVLDYVDRAPVVVCARASLDDGAALSFRRLAGDVHDSILDDTTPHLGQTTIRRDVLLEFDSTFPAVEDVEWWLRTAASAKVWSYPEPDYLVRRHDGPRHGNGRRARIRGSEMLLEKHRAYFDEHPAARAHRLDRLAQLRHDERRPGVVAAAFQAFLAKPSTRRAALILLYLLPTSIGRGLRQLVA